MKANVMHTAGVMAIRIGVMPHHLVRLAKRGLIPHVKIDRVHAFAEADEPKIREALIKAGFLKPAQSRAG
jgi:hypothetical protein